MIECAIAEQTKNNAQEVNVVAEAIWLSAAPIYMGEKQKWADATYGNQLHFTRVAQDAIQALDKFRNRSLEAAKDSPL